MEGLRPAVPPSHETHAAGGTDVDIAIHHAGDRLMGLDARDRLSDQQLVPRRDGAHPGATHPGTRRVQAPAASTTTEVRISPRFCDHPGDPAVLCTESG